MFERILERMRKLLRGGQYVLTVHGLEAMEDDELTILDVEKRPLSLIVGRTHREGTPWGGSGRQLRPTGREIEKR